MSDPWICPRCGTVNSPIMPCCSCTLQTASELYSFTFTGEDDTARLDYMLRLYEAELDERLTRADLDRMMQIEKEEADESQ